ncbi:KamA family radical SAM protein [Sediminispirochaeta bajacaliforniensis]|uniref:KamA family radical SAM protein n=1 Tax=Sediminispirochaeta bajacaliforniensis TaxID=148 RepID=UPI000375C352|nr:KamA family radical SAM protein [Sediminispirochaeta bajacaliforniensis]
MESWQRELKERVTNLDELERFLHLEDEERAWFDSEEERRLPFALTRHYLSLMGDDPASPLRRQAIPRKEEFRFLSYESADPLCEQEYSPLPRLIHRYEDRALFLASDRCALYCRHCFRRHFTGGAGQGDREVKNRKDRRSLFEAAQDAACYLEKRPEIRELLLSGGDPLMLPDGTLFRLIDLFRKHRPDLILRIGTRMPAVLPSRITPVLAREFGRRAPLFVVCQFNHPDEISPPAVEALARLADSGIPILNQSVLLRGVNDDRETLKALSGVLLAARVIPYYLFQGDLAAGTSHLRAPILKGVSIMRSLRQCMSGLATPVYAVDLPGGGGKVSIPLDPVLRVEEREALLPGPDNRLWPYPVED